MCLSSCFVQPKPVAWSKQKEKKAKKKVQQKEGKQSKRRRCVDDDDCDELASDIRLMKKLKAGKVRYGARSVL